MTINIDLPLKTTAKRPVVCTLIYGDLCTFEFGIAVEVFGRDRPEFENWYEFRTVAVEPGPLHARGGVTITAQSDLSALADATLILIPGWNDVDEPVPNELIAAIQNAHANGARIASICSGTFVLAAAGLLDGRQATTHWLLTDKFRKRFPLVNVNDDVLYIDEGDVLTSAGSAAGLDLCLHIVRQDWGASYANVVARRLVLAAQREGGQRQFVTTPVPQDRGGQISPLLDRIKTDLNEAWPVARMAKEAGLSERTLARRFRDVTGETPLAWLKAIRVQHATELLETTSATLSDITTASGFGTPETFRREFKRSRGITPSRYRIAFGNKGPDQ